MLFMSRWSRSSPHAARLLLTSAYRAPIRLFGRCVAAGIAVFSFLFVGLAGQSWGDTSAKTEKPEQNLKQLSLEQLGNVEVTTASKEPEKLSRVPAAIYVVTQEDIRRSGATSIPEVLRLVPGVEVARIDSDSWSIGVRGFGSRLSRSVLVLIDGRSVYTPLFAGVYWDVQDTLLEDIERIEVIRGPGGTIWGADAVNGVINIITKSAKDTHGLLASVGGGNLDQGLIGFRYGAGSNKGFDYRFYGKAFTRGPEFHPDNQQFDDWRMGQAGFRTDWALNSRDTVTFQGDLYQGDAGESVVITAYSPPSVAIVQQNAELAGGNLVARWRRVLGAGSDLELQTYYDRTDRQGANLGEVRNTFDVDFVHHLTLPLRQNFIWGLGTRTSSGTVRMVVPTIVFAPPQRTDNLFSAFVQDEIPIAGDHLSLMMGSKFLHNDYTGFEIQPSVRLLWMPTTRQTFWAAVTRAVRTPSRVEEDLSITALLTAAPPAFFRLIGDGHFSSEQLVGYEAGYRNLVRSNVHVDVAVFYNDYSHLLSAEPGAPFSETTPPPAHVVLPFFIRNGLLGTTSGIEIAPEWSPESWWRLKSSYAYLNMDLQRRTGSLDPGTAASTEGSSPRHQVMAESLINCRRNFEWDQTYRYVSALPAEHVGAYQTADVRFSWHPAERIEFSVIGQNLFQPHHAEAAGDPGPLVGIKRSVYGKIAWRR